jgi:hypothetical protein
MAARSAPADRPPTDELVPLGTVALVRIADVAALKEDFLDTALGQMSQDPQMQPVVDALYGAALDAAAALEEQLGMSLEEIIAIPDGELSLALVPVEDASPALVLLLDGGQSPERLEDLLASAARQIEAQGGRVGDAVVEGADVTVVSGPNAAQGQAAYFLREGTLVASSSVEGLRAVVLCWDGSADTLADDPDYADVMTRSRGADRDPQVTWFADPIGMVEAFRQGTAALQLVLAALPALGLDGVRCAGGSVTLAGEQFDSIVRAHLLLDEPRTGVAAMLALESAEAEPEAWVPADAASYTTIHWDMATTFEELRNLVDSFQGEGAFDRRAQQAGERAGVDIEQEVVGAFDNRISYVTLIEAPITLTSQATIVGVRLKDATVFQATLDGLIERYGDALEERTYAGTTYYQVVPPALGGPPEGTPWRAACFGLVGDELLVADRAGALERALRAAGDPQGGLAQSLEYKLIAGRIARQSGGTTPSMVTFRRPSEQFRVLYALASPPEEDERQRLEADNPFLQGIRQALDEHPLPPFEVIESYFAPGGAVLVNDETGLHYTSFTLRREAP